MTNTKKINNFDALQIPKLTREFFILAVTALLKK